MDNQTGPTLHETLFNVTWQPGWKESLRVKGYVDMYSKSFPSSPETITMLLHG